MSAGTLFRRMVVSGRVDVGPDLADEAVAQLRLRYRLSALVADEYADAGFVAVVQDVALGDDLPAWVSMFRHPPQVVVLAPSAQAVQTREAARDKTGYGDWTVDDLDAGLRGSTPRIGLWLDTSEQTPDQTVDAIVTELAREPRTSAGILLFRRTSGLEVLLGHMGGPFWARKDEGAWTIPKGEPAPGEDPLVTALREFAEEIGAPAPSSEPIPLGDVKQSGGKVVTAWAVEGDLDASAIDEQPGGDRVAAAVGEDAAGPGARPGRVVHARRGATRRGEGSGGVRGPAGGAAQVRWSNAPSTQPMWRSAERRTTALASVSMTFAKLP